MKAREVIVLALTPFSHLPERDASYVIGTLKEKGFTIMSKEDVEAVRAEAIAEYKAAIDSLKNVTDADIERVRDKALEEAMGAQCDGCRDRLPINAYDYHQFGHHTYPCKSTAIRSLKSGGRDGKEARE